MSQTEITKCEKMDRETFYQYILDNFTLSGEEQRMVDTILQFIESHYSDYDKQQEVIRELLCDIDGGLIQEKLKSFNDFEREFVKTGYCPECQEDLFMKELSKNENCFFTQDDIRDDEVEKFLNDAAEVHVDENGILERVLDCRKAILSPNAEKLSVNEKLLYLYEFNLENEFEVDLDTGKVTEIK